MNVPAGQFTVGEASIWSGTELGRLSAETTVTCAAIDQFVALAACVVNKLTRNTTTSALFMLIASAPSIDSAIHSHEWMLRASTLRTALVRFALGSSASP